MEKWWRLEPMVGDPEQRMTMETSAAITSGRATSAFQYWFPAVIPSRSTLGSGEPI
jgi:hypothetical protein